MFFYDWREKRNLGQIIRVCFEKMNWEERKLYWEPRMCESDLQFCWCTTNNNNNNKCCCDRHHLLEPPTTLQKRREIEIVSNLSFVWQFNFAQTEKIFHLCSSQRFFFNIWLSILFWFGIALALGPLLYSISSWA